MPGVAENFNTVIDKMTFTTDFKHVTCLHTEHVNLTHEDLNTSPNKQENRLNIHLVSYDTSISRAKPSNNGQLSDCSWRFGICDEFHRYKATNCVGWHIVMNARIGFKHQVTTTLGFYSLYNWCFQTMWLISGMPEDPEDDSTVMEIRGADALSCAVKSSMHAIRTDDQEA
jgi:hypothetical protein